MFKKGKRLAVLCTIIFVVLSMCMPCLADETQKTIRVGSFEDTFNYVDEHGVRRGYGYELMQALAGYTGWKFDYIKCDWSNCFEKLENGEIDIMGDIAYTDDRAKEMLYSEETMGEEKYVLYANLSDMDIVSSDFKSLNGKRIGVLKGTNSEFMLTNWENKYGIHTEHVNVSGNEDVKKKLANNEIDCFVSLEESIWSERGISSVTTIGESDIYFVINKERSDIKQELDYAMRQLDSDSPFFKADLYKKYFTLDYTQFLTGVEKSYIKEHGGIRIGFLDNDPVVFSMDKKSGEIRGTLSEYISYAKDCLGNHTLKFDIEAFDDYDKMIEALQNNEIDVIYYASRNSNVAEKKGYALSNTAWTYNLIAVTNKEGFNENDSYVVAVPKNKVALKQHIAYNYPHWKLVDCDSIEDEAKKKNIHVRYTFNVEHKHVMADVTKVEEIFVNILSNALKYTPSNGSVEVNVDELSCDEPGYMIVRTSIMDTGIGMSQEYLEKIFESFSRERMTSSKISGTGLGMAIVKKYVDLLGGTIDVKSVLGKGSTFIVTLKYKMADEKYYLDKQEENCEVDNAIFNGKHILLAEDNDLNAEIAQTILERAGLFVDRVKNGIECVNRVIENPVGTYDVILMDIQMPKMDGYKATCEIRNLQDKAKACIPIVAITANAFEEDKKKAIDVGMDGHISKPINIEDLFVVLTDILNKQKS